MKSVIYLNLQQKKMLDEANIGVTTLTPDVLKTKLTVTDCRNIFLTTEALLQPGMLLAKYGFESIPSDGDSTLFPVIIPNLIIHNAACVNKEAIVIWEEASAENDTYDMFRRSMINIVKAMSTVLLFEDVKHSKQFQTCLLNY